MYTNTYFDVNPDDTVPTDEFLIDKTVGKSSKIQMDFIDDTNSIQQVIVRGPNNYVFTYPFDDVSANFVVLELGDLQASRETTDGDTMTRGS